MRAIMREKYFWHRRNFGISEYFKSAIGIRIFIENITLGMLYSHNAASRDVSAHLQTVTYSLRFSTYTRISVGFVEFTICLRHFF